MTVKHYTKNPLVLVVALFIYLSLPRISIGMFNTGCVSSFLGTIVGFLLVLQFVFKKFRNIRIDSIIFSLYLVYIIVQLSLLTILSLVR
ncbi:Uncharacterised protein [Streptococcus merionis]|uniref:Uncharacterized protein n=1 Tax=Streptococcus merionis TaxID=400065 RepID=A0A239SP66_9STRE|nr:Uncharacterised protein [Streptococcus merionis]